MNATVKPASPGIIFLSDVRASFLYCFQPFMPRQAKPGEYPKYLSHFILTPTHPDLKRIAEVIEKVGAEKWKDKWPEVKAQLKGQDKLCLHKGDVSKAGKPEYAGMFYISCSGPNLGRTRFSCFHADGVTQAVEADGLLYSGVRCNAKLNVWPQDNPQGGRRINCTVTGIQHLAHAPAFTSGAAPAAAGEFGNVGGVAGADAPVPSAAADDDLLS
jgi:hypothetical protein